MLFRSLPLLLVSGCTLGPTVSSESGCVGCAFVRVEGGAGRVGYFRGVARATVFAAEETVLDEAEPIVL